MRGAGSPLTATRVDGLEPCSIVDDGGTRFLKASSAYPDPDPGFHPDPGSLWYPGAGTLPPLSALPELLPRGGLVRGSVVSVAEFGVLALALLAGASATGPGAASPEFPWPGFSPRESWAWTSSGRCWSRISGTPLLGGCEIVLVRPPGPPPAQVRQRLEAVLRRGRSVLLIAGDWPGVPARLRVTARRLGRTRRRVRAAAGVPRGGDGGWPRGGQVLRRNCAVCGRSAPGRTRRV